MILRFKIDRHNSYRQLVGFYFPHHEFPTRPLRNTIVDGELVLDVDPRTQQVGDSFQCWYEIK